MWLLNIIEIGIGIDYTAKDVLGASRESKDPWALAKGFDGASLVNGFNPISKFSDINNI